MELKNAVSLLESCTQYVDEYRNEGLETCLLKNQESAEDLNVTTEFKVKRMMKKKKIFSYEFDHTAVATDEESTFKMTVFNSILDVISSSLNERFNQLDEFEQTWGILFDLTVSMDSGKFKKHCLHLHSVLTSGNSSDINGTEMFDEIISLNSLLPKNVNSPLKTLNFLKANNLGNVVPNIWVALRILLTIPVTVATAERSFSKSKLIKTYLRSTMGQERLSSLAILSIENDLVKSIDIHDRTMAFVDLKQRKKFI